MTKHLHGLGRILKRKPTGPHAQALPALLLSATALGHWSNNIHPFPKDADLANDNPPQVQGKFTTAF